MLAAPVRKSCSEHVAEAAEPGGAVKLHDEHGAIAVDDEGGEAVVLAVQQPEACHARVSEEPPSTPIGCFEPLVQNDSSTRVCVVASTRIRIGDDGSQRPTAAVNARLSSNTIARSPGRSVVGDGRDRPIEDLGVPPSKVPVGIFGDPNGKIAIRGALGGPAAHVERRGNTLVRTATACLLSAGEGVHALEYNFT